MKRIGYWGAVLLLALLVTACGIQQEPQFDLLGKPNQGNIRINVLLNTDATDAVQAELSSFGNIMDVIESIDAVSMLAPADQLDDISRLPFVESASPDAERKGIPIDTVQVPDFVQGLSTWNLDAVNVTEALSFDRTLNFDGNGVYVAVLDTGLMDTWRQYFPEERIAEEYAMSFGGGGGEQGSVSTQPNKWEHDVNGHGSHVTSTIIGYSQNGTPINGVAPMATVIPVKVLNQNGSGWSSVVAAGIAYIGGLKSGPLAHHPVVINMSLGGPVLDVVEKAALDYAIDQGVVIVASAGNEGEAGMGYPGAYGPVISVAASGWTGEWVGGGSWWYAGNVSESAYPDDFYITDFSSREKPGQDLDIAAPGSWVVGPYQLNSGQTSYYYLGGTSMASPHVAGIVALMLQQDAARSQSEIEGTLESAAIPFDYSGDKTLCRGIIDPNVGETEVCWGEDASGAGLITADAALGLTGDSDGSGGDTGSDKPGKDNGRGNGRGN